MIALGKLVSRGPTHHSTGTARNAAQTVEFKRYRGMFR
jgi:hypothetical protein